MIGVPFADLRIAEAPDREAAIAYWLLSQYLRGHRERARERADLEERRVIERVERLKRGDLPRPASRPALEWVSYGGMHGTSAHFQAR